MLKPIFYCSVWILLASCNRGEVLVKPVFIDSLLSHYTPSPMAAVNDSDLAFWNNRVQKEPGSFVNLSKYASALAGRFHLYGDIKDLRAADSIMQKIAHQYHEPGMLLSLAGYKMMQHRFAEAKEAIDSVVAMKAERYAAQMMLFDADFELGDEFHSGYILKKNYAPSDYAYNFRLSKFDHYKGQMDSAIAHMMKAASLAMASPYLKTAALSNAADLCIHNGEMKKASELYQQCIRFNSSDFHSIMGLGWIALVYNGNDSLAKKIFAFAAKHLESPDPLLKLSQAYEGNNSSKSKQYAGDFVAQVSKPVYGNMYNKYLVQVYTSVLNDPAKALKIAQKEINNRRTPQTAAWLAWCLFLNNRQGEAYEVYRQSVAGRPLETLELYWMGKMMKGLGKGYNAKQFFEAAEKNQYDLSPAMRKDLGQNL
jgi:hypothetical protein